MACDSDMNQDTGQWLAAELSHGRAILLRALEDAGGLWSDEEVARHFNITLEAVQEWTDRSKILAVEHLDGHRVYPSAQFERRGAMLSAPHSFVSIAAIITAAGDMNREELAGLLVTPQDWFATRDGISGSALRARTGFEAIADGDAHMVIELVRDLAIPADEGAPPMPPDWPAKSGGAGRNREDQSPK